MKTKTNKNSKGNLINKLELSIALAAMRKDSSAERQFTKALEIAINSTSAPAFIG